MSSGLTAHCSAEEFEELLQEAEDTLNLGKGGAYPTMTYEDGIMETSRWVFYGGPHPYAAGKWRIVDFEPS